MLFNLQGEWSQEALQDYLADLMINDPQKAAEFSLVAKELQVKVPDRVFEDIFDGELGDVRFQVIHMGGHSLDAAVVWLPEQCLLYASDLIFQGRYPYVFDADIPAWINALDRLLEFQADEIIPGHGVRCTAADIICLRDYLQHTWQLTEQHLRSGHSFEETYADPAYPVFASGKKEKLHAANIRYMYEKLAG